MIDEDKASRSRIFGPFQRSLAQWLQRRYDLSAPIPAEHASLLGRLDQPVEMTDLNHPGCKFKVGQTVQFSADGLYVVTAVLPERDGQLEYCISNEAAPYQRVAKESELR
jgi:hypothetical protein